MARAPIVVNVNRTSGSNGALRVVSGADTVYIYERGTTTPVNVYAASSGGSPLTAPFTTDDYGRVVDQASDELWVEPDFLDIVATDNAVTYTIPYVAGSTVDSAEFEAMHDAVINITDPAYGGVGDGATDNADAFAAAFADLPADGGEILIPPGEYVTSEPITPPAYTKMRGLGAHSWDANIGPVRISSAAGFTGALLHGEAGVGSVTVENLAFNGRRSSEDDTIGIRLETATGWVFRDIHVSAFRAQGFKGEAGLDLFVDNMWLLGCCLERTGLSGYIGVFEHNGADAILHGIRATASITTDWGDGVGGPGSGYIVGIYLKSSASNAHITSCFGHISQTGMVIQAARCHIAACRTDLNQAGGWQVVGSYNRIVGCSSYRDGMGADVTYDAMTLHTGNGNVVTGFQAESLVADTNTIRHGVVDACPSGLPNQIIAPQGIGLGGSVVYDVGATIKPVVQGWGYSSAYGVASAANLALPAYADLISVTGTTTVTSITKSYAGRTVTLVFTGILTFTDGSNLKLAGNFVTTADDSITLVCDGTNWVEVARSVN